jgi:predicted choloylglycine hydrolase
MTKSFMNPILVICFLFSFQSELITINAETNINEEEIIYLSGSPYEIAYNKSKFYINELENWEGISNRLFNGPNGAALRLTYQFQLTKIREKCPAIIQEWQGMADASKVLFIDIAVAMIGEKTLKMISCLPYGITSNIYTDEKSCSVFAITTSDRGPIIVNTGDSHNFPSSPKIYYIEEDNIGQYHVIRCKGAGVNEMGLASGGANAHYGGRSILSEKLLSDISQNVLRYCPNVDSAINFIQKYPVGDGYHVVVADISGKAAAIEKGPQGLFNIRWADSAGYVFTTNVSPDSLLRSHCTSNQDYINNSDNRYNNLESLFSDSSFTFTFDEIENIAFNHDSIGAICQHGDIFPGQWYTTRTRLVLPAEGKVLLAAKTDSAHITWRPCECGWIEDSLTLISGIIPQLAISPEHFKLTQNYPNPFNGQTIISYELFENSNIELKIYNLLGEEVIALKNDFQIKGNYSVMWNGKDEYNHDVASGIYYYQLQSDDRQLTKRMTLIK